MGGSGEEMGRGAVLGAEKGSSLKALLRYSWSESGFHLACSPKQSACIVLGAKTISYSYIQLDSLGYMTDNSQIFQICVAGVCVVKLLGLTKHH